MKKILISLIICMLYNISHAEDKKASQLRTKNDVIQFVQKKIGELRRLKTNAKKLTALEELRGRLNEEQDNLNSDREEIKAKSDMIAVDLETPADDNVQGVNKTNINVAVEDKNQTDAKLEQIDSLLLEWSHYETLLRPMFDFFLDHKTQAKNSPYEANCESIQGDLNDKTNSEKSNQLLSDLLKITHDLCQ